MPPMTPLARLAWTLFAAAALTPVSAAALPAAPPRAELAAQQGDPKPHKHAWVKQSRKEWVPPETKVVQVGVDAKGKPIFETRVVRPGYWKTVAYQACSCGAVR